MRTTFHIPLIFLCLALGACQDFQFRNREKGALAGTVVGGGLGAIVGHQTGSAGAGVAIGSAAGAIAGGLIGNEFDRQDDRLAARDQRLRSNDDLIRENQRLIDQLKRGGADAYESGRGVVVNLPDVLFEFNRSDLTPDASRVVTEVAGVLSGVEDRRVSIEGHTDSIGTILYNQRLSEARANTVAAALVRQGISRRRIATQGFGESRPISTNGTNQGRAKNRRVEIIIENN